eukprot:GCRY01003498.1.p1 GENE.GCRY01003498.1~~GCRY01003498.1.p1  ORF type:complete len:164 (+),score=13.00 GCRY01003498.1:234-725(+)
MKRKSKSKGGPFIPSHLSDKSVKANTLWVGNMDPKMTEYSVMKLFQPFGEIKSLQFIWHSAGPLKGQPKGYCFVEFATKESATEAMMKLDHRLVFGKPLFVKFTDDRDFRMLDRKDKTSKSKADTSKEPSFPELLEEKRRAERIAAIKAKLQAKQKLDEPSKP